MIITVDIGNTQIKIAQFERERIIKKTALNHLDEVWRLINELEPSEVIWCSVKTFPEDFYSKIKAEKSTHQHYLFNSSTPIPINNQYKTPKTLGLDRLAGAIGATSIFPSRPVLIIDAGTCITYDFVNHQNEYIGGSISPGFMLRYKALHQYTDKLPLLNIISSTKIIGNNTLDAIQSGVVNGVVAEINGICDIYNKQYSQLKTIICGGDAEFIYHQIKENKHVENFIIEKDLIHIGLKKILQHLNSIN
ncbi:MAG: type III pantothenate kinase [Cytophagales bacterium]|nr:MAG: type III pantothenate kinase [Cytophagales bacterium]